MTNIDPLIEDVTPDTQWYVVLRPFTGSGRMLDRGEVVDTTGWRNVGQLRDQRYLTPLPYGVTVPDEHVVDGVPIRMLDPSKHGPEGSGGRTRTAQHQKNFPEVTAEKARRGRKATSDT